MMKYSRIIAPLLALMLVFALVGCGEDEPATSGFDERSIWTKKVLAVNAIANWAGLDIQGANLQVGDVIEIKGVLMQPAGRQILLNLNHSNWRPLQGWAPALKAEESFEKTFTLSATTEYAANGSLAAVTGDIGAIAAASPTNLRVRLNNPGTFVITDLTVKRGTTTLVDLSKALESLPKGKMDHADVNSKFAGIQGAAGDDDANAMFIVLGP